MAKFELGELISTKGVVRRIWAQKGFGAHVLRSLNRYTRCDWGEMDDEDKEMNDMAIGPNEDSVLAVYEHPKHPEWKIVINTEADRSVTTIHFPHEH